MTKTVKRKKKLQVMQEQQQQQEPTEEWITNPKIDRILKEGKNKLR
jgi:histone H3/H4